MQNDVKRLVEAVPGFRYQEVSESVKVRRACERWVVLDAGHRALTARRAKNSASGEALSASDLWKE